jgi:transcription antitermination factor NusA-like protein
MLRLADDGKNVISIASSGASSETASVLVDMLFSKIIRIAEQEAQQKMLFSRVQGVNLNFGAVSSFHVNPEYLGLLIGVKGSNIKSAQAISGEDY